MLANQPESANHPLHAFALGAARTEFLSFQLGSVSYAIDILKVQEIRAYEPPTRMANAPASVKGVLNLRGVIVPIIDLRTKLGLPLAEFDSATVTVVLTLEHGVVGAIVDSVSDVVDINPAEVKPAPRFDAGTAGHFVTGITTQTTGGMERLLMLLDIDSALALNANEPVTQMLQ